MASGEDALVTIPLLSVVSGGPDVGRQYRLADETTIGRTRRNDVQLEDDEVSRHHVRVVRQPDRWTVEDLASTHGTFLDGIRINGITTLRDQQTIRVGGVDLLFCEHGVWDREAEAERCADPVTGVANRAYFLQRVGEDIARARQDAPMCVVAVDITQLRAINQRDGIAAGDAVLRALATRLREVVGDRGHVGRIGGDEVGACLPGHTRESARALTSAVEPPRPDVRLSWGFAELEGSQDAASVVRAAVDDTR